MHPVQENSLLSFSVRVIAHASDLILKVYDASWSFFVSKFYPHAKVLLRRASFSLIRFGRTMLPPLLKFACNATLLALKTVLVAASFFIFATYQIIRMSLLLASKVTRAAIQTLLPYVIIGGILLGGYLVFSYFSPPAEPSPPERPRRRAEPQREPGAPELLKMIQDATTPQQTEITTFFEDVLGSLYFCGIHQTLIIDPVRDPTTTGEAHTYYERTAIEEWLATHGTSPITRKPLRSEELQQPDPEFIERRNQALVDHRDRLLRTLGKR